MVVIDYQYRLRPSGTVELHCKVQTDFPYQYVVYKYNYTVNDRDPQYIYWYW